MMGMVGEVQHHSRPTCTTGTGRRSPLLSTVRPSGNNFPVPALPSPLLHRTAHAAAGSRGHTQTHTLADPARAGRGRRVPGMGGLGRCHWRCSCWRRARTSTRKAKNRNPIDVDDAEPWVQLPARGGWGWVSGWRGQGTAFLSETTDGQSREELAQALGSRRRHRQSVPRVPLQFALCSLLTFAPPVIVAEARGKGRTWKGRSM